MRGVSTVKWEIRSFTMADFKSNPTDAMGEADVLGRLFPPATIQSLATTARFSNE